MPKYRMVGRYRCKTCYLLIHTIIVLIRKATAVDKNQVLRFCKDTFSWGDYVDLVWDYWLSEGSLLLFEIQSPVGICHASYSEGQVWIEGIRVDPNFRRQKIASKLVRHAESIGREKNVSSSFMLVDAENTPSLSMADSMGYEISQTWNFYSLVPKRNSDYNVRFEKSLDYKVHSHYVKSWRWLPISNFTLSAFYEQNKIVTSGTGAENSTAILTDSEHFKKTLIVTLFSGSQDTTLQIIPFLQNYGITHDYQRIHILTREQLPLFDSLKHRTLFCLMRKLLV